MFLASDNPMLAFLSVSLSFGVSIYIAAIYESRCHDHIWLYFMNVNT